MRKFVIASLVLIGLFSIGCNNNEADSKHQEEVMVVKDRLAQAKNLLEEMEDSRGNVVKVENRGVKIMGIYATWRLSPGSNSLMNMMSRCAGKKLKLVSELEKVSRKAMVQATNLPKNNAEKKVKILIEGSDGFVTILQQFASQQQICQPINEMKKDGGNHII
jgi:hypothetical protein